MPSLPFIGFVVWVATSIISALLSGGVYFHINNLWILLVPTAAFSLSYALHLYMRSMKPRAKIYCVGDGVLSKEVISSRKATMLGFSILAVACYALWVSQGVIGTSILEAQNVRDSFFTDDVLLALGGSYFVWVNWAILGIIYGVLMAGAVAEINSGRTFSGPVVISFLGMLAYSLMTGARGGLLTMMLLYAGVWMPFINFKKIRKKSAIKTLLKAAFLPVLMFLFMVAIRAESTAADVEVGNITFIKYFVGPVFALDQLVNLDYVDEIRVAMGRFGILLYGLDTFLVSGFMRGILGVDVGSALANTSAYFHNGVQIAPGITMNAHYTAGAKAYIEFGLLGYGLFFFSLAGAALYVENSRHLKLNSCRPALYSVVLVSILYSTRETLVDWPQFYIGLLAFAALRR